MNFSIRKKLWISVILFVFTLISVSSGLLYQIKLGHEFTDNIVKDHMRPMELLSDVNNRLQGNHIHLMLALQHDPVRSTSKFHEHDVSVHLNKIAENKKAIDELFARYDHHDFITGEKQLLESVKTARDDYVKNGLLPTLKIIEEGDYDYATELLLKEVNPRVNNAYDALGKLSGALRNGVATEVSEDEDYFATTRNYIVGALVFICIACIFASSLIIKSITVPIANAIKNANTIASGDLTENIVGDSRSETGLLLLAFGEMNHSLLKIVNEVRVGADSITNSSHEISVGNSDLASRTERQASALEQTASSVEELASGIRMNSDSAREADGMVKNTSAIVAKAGNSMGDVVNVMKSIDESSRQIVDIISVIDGIAFQTNILALNAAVEAARAGKHGLGFAVVASEVRSLAQRSADAAKEVKKLILNSVERVETGIELVHTTGNTIDNVVKSVDVIVQMIASISASSHEQWLGIEEINKAISDIDGATQQNAALVEEASAATESLEKQAMQLKQTISMFKTVRVWYCDFWIEKFNESLVFTQI